MDGNRSVKRCRVQDSQETPVANETDELFCFSADTAYSCDPRIKKFKEEEKARKESEKKAKADAKKREQEEKERVSLVCIHSKCVTPASVACSLTLSALRKSISIILTFQSDVETE